ncbi:MAG: AAA-like domain-containing protein [Lachnospiraceae bacterium]|nr:AAA-like domain-containing protein [Lachnospiraceae bacterium]
MKRRFNVTGSCVPQRHYMVSLDDRLKKIKEDYVDYGSYFVINRGRQYGKTTTLWALADYLSEEYLVFSLDFQEMPDEKFENGETFSRAFVNMLLDTLQYQEGEEEQRIYGMLSDFIGQNLKLEMDELFRFLSRMCRECKRPIVLIIDEVDSAGNNQVFVQFLALLRGAYLKRDRTPTFHSVILAGVYDIKNLKLKIRPESEHQYNSPWNIAAVFNVNMDFDATQIVQMLEEYEADHYTGMNIQEIAEEIFAYTSGYPVLVSMICKYLDEDLSDENDFAKLQQVWTKKGVGQAVRWILDENIPLFESMVRQLDTYRELEALIEGILYQGRRIPFNRDEKAFNIGVMFGFLKNRDGQVAVANRIFEMRLLNLFVTREAIRSEIYAKGEGDRSQFIRNGKLDMDAVLKKFVEHFSDIWSKSDESFVEKYGRKFFLLYLKPIINGTGNYYIEAETRDLRRTDVIVDYLGEQFVVELKIWHGNEYHERGEQQLVDYLDYYHKDKGYMLSFNFNQKKQIGVKTITVGDKTVVEAVV